MTYVVAVAVDIVPSLTSWLFHRKAPFVALELQRSHAEIIVPTKLSFRADVIVLDSLGRSNPDSAQRVEVSLQALDHPLSVVSRVAASLKRRRSCCFRRWWL